MNRWKVYLCGILLIFTSNSLFAVSSGYTYRVMERRAKEKTKRLRNEQIKSDKYQSWQKGFIKRVRCLNVDKATASQSTLAYCFNLPQGGQKATSTQTQPTQNNNQPTKK